MALTPPSRRQRRSPAPREPTLHAVHCVPKPVFPYWEGLLDDDTRERWLADARLDLQGQLWRVLGAEPRVASTDVRLGTTADRVVWTAAVPCLITNRPLLERLRRVIIAVDFSKPSLHALREGVNRIASVIGPHEESALPVEILYVSAFASPSARPVPVDSRLSEQADAARERLAGRGHVEVRPRILSAPLPVDGILRAAEESETSLIILGTHGSGTLARALLGSVASAAARTVPFPLLLVPPPAPGVSPE